MSNQQTPFAQPHPAFQQAPPQPPFHEQPPQQNPFGQPQQNPFGQPQQNSQALPQQPYGVAPVQYVPQIPQTQIIIEDHHYDSKIFNITNSIMRNITYIISSIVISEFHLRFFFLFCGFPIFDPEKISSNFRF